MASPKPKRLSVKWLNPTLLSSGVSYTLCTSEEQFDQLMRHMLADHRDGSRWINPGACATTHHLARYPDRSESCVVCIDGSRTDVTGVQVASLLVHEAVHVWQRILHSMGETDPSPEFEAYSIQGIAQNLMQSYVDQTKA